MVRRGGAPITSWSDLLDPRLTKRLAFLESPRELVGVALKTMGLGYNTKPAQVVSAGISMLELHDRVRLLCSQVRVQTPQTPIQSDENLFPPSEFFCFIDDRKSGFILLIGSLA